jgi:hypothetical protein
MLNTSMTDRFFQIEGRYRYDWCVTLGSGEALRLKTGFLTKDGADVAIILDAKWQGTALGNPADVDKLLGKSLPLLPDEDSFVETIRLGGWAMWEKDV